MVRTAGGRLLAFWFCVPLVAAASCMSRLPDQDLRILSASVDAKLSADLLWKAFQDNAAEARRTYFGKVVEITGTATEIGKDAPGERFVRFGDATGATDAKDLKDAKERRGRVRANLLDDTAGAVLSAIPDSKRMTLRCFCEGLAGDVILKSCIKP
jgi:hypothetical protein